MTNGAERLLWRKSSRCDSGACVEVAINADRVLVRQSDNPDGPVLTFTHPEWAAFLGWLREHDSQ